MTIRNIRLSNLQTLVAEYKTHQRLAEVADVSDKNLQRILSGGRLKSGKLASFGDPLARKLEAGTGYPEGWMDVDHSGDPIATVNFANLPPEENELLRHYRAASRKKKAAILAVARLREAIP